MRTYLTAHDIANTARMVRVMHVGAILLTEGTTDARVYGRFVNDANCKLIPAFGKDNATDAISILETDKFYGILAIIDTDFWRLDGISSNTSNILLTDAHDLESMLLFSNALEKVLSEFGSSTKIRKLGKPIREILHELALPLGFLRWLSSPSKDNLLLTFNGLNFDRFLKKKPFIINIDNLIIEVKTNSRNSTLDANIIKTKIIALRGAGHDPWQVCSGHDMVQILSFSLKNIFGNHKGKIITPEVLEGILRVSYEYSDFCLTELYKSIKNWEKVNSPFKVLID